MHALPPVTPSLAACTHTVTPDAVFSYVYKAMALYQNYDVLSIGQQQVRGRAGRGGAGSRSWLVGTGSLVGWLFNSVQLNTVQTACLLNRP